MCFITQTESYPSFMSRLTERIIPLLFKHDLFFQIIGQLIIDDCTWRWTKQLACQVNGCISTLQWSAKTVLVYKHNTFRFKSFRPNVIPWISKAYLQWVDGRFMQGDTVSHTSKRLHLADLEQSLPGHTPGWGSFKACVDFSLWFLMDNSVPWIIIVLFFFLFFFTWILFFVSL